MKENGSFGAGSGLFLFDGEKIRHDNPELFEHYAAAYLS